MKPAGSCLESRFGVEVPSGVSMRVAWPAPAGDLADLPEIQLLELEEFRTLRRFCMAGAWLSWWLLGFFRRLKDLSPALSFERSWVL